MLYQSARDLKILQKKIESDLSMIENLFPSSELSRFSFSLFSVPPLKKRWKAHKPPGPTALRKVIVVLSKVFFKFSQTLRKFRGTCYKVLSK